MSRGKGYTKDRFAREMEDINKLRQSMGMTVIKYGQRLCSRCKQPFFSYNLITNIWCDNCRRVLDNYNTEEYILNKR